MANEGGEHHAPVDKSCFGHLVEDADHLLRSGLRLSADSLSCRLGFRDSCQFRKLIRIEHLIAFGIDHGR